MRKPYFLFSLTFYLLSWVVLYFSPAARHIFEWMLNNADILFPFSLYRGMASPGVRPEWVFGGYTPFFELALGLLIWLLFKNVTLTLIGYALFQSVLIFFSLVYFLRCVAGRNGKITALTLLVMALTNLLAASGWFQALLYQYLWYLHISTIAFTLIALGLLIQFSTSPAGQYRRATLLKLSGVCILAMLSDALFIPQLVAPALALLVGMSLFGLISARLAGLAALSLAGSTAIGWALFRIPVLWGSQRIALDGFYIRLEVDWILNNTRPVIQAVSSAWGNQPVVTLLWGGFYLLCAALALVSTRRLRLSRQGTVRKHLVMGLFFFPLQLVSGLSAGLFTVEPDIRYFLPMFLFPLGWGWLLLALQVPGWMKWAPPRKLIWPGLVLGGMTAAALISLLPGGGGLGGYLDYYPEDIHCVDQKTTELQLHAGIAQYWLARRFSVYSQTGLHFVQAMPDLSPYPLLADIHAYDRDFDFVIVENGPQYFTAIDRMRVIERFGLPAATFTCANFEALIYNRASDGAFSNQYDDFVKSWN